MIDWWPTCMLCNAHRPCQALKGGCVRHCAAKCYKRGHTRAWMHWLGAAGNYGDSSASSGSTVGGGSSSSITSPALAKNCLTVGASLNLEGPNPGTLDVSVLALRVAVALPGGQSYERVLRVVQASFGGAWAGLSGKQLKVRAASLA